MPSAINRGQNRYILKTLKIYNNQPGVVYMGQVGTVNRADLCHENFSSLPRDDSELPKDKFTTNRYWICLSNLL